MDTHPVLDSLNVYGMRWLMPFSGRWLYGDTLFIVDPWVWMILVTGVYLSVRRARIGIGPVGRPALVSLSVLGIYVGVMAVSNVAGRRIVVGEASEAGIPVRRLMVAPVAVNPFRRWVVLEDTSRYRVGTLEFLPVPHFELSEWSAPAHAADPAILATLRGEIPRRFLTWARFPYVSVEGVGDNRLLHLGDARYTLDPSGSWASVTVPVVDVAPPTAEDDVAVRVSPVP
jgi:inner membrane protein